MTIIKYKKKYINKGIKEKIWLLNFGKNFEVYCPTCNIRKLNPFSFSTGHIIPEIKGGTLALDNLIPICTHCNSRIGTLNYYEYKNIISNNVSK
jgi:5-methylcytosine-specific restriction endonuclease McrA